jgi:hypothetical protein
MRRFVGVLLFCLSMAAAGSVYAQDGASPAANPADNLQFRPVFDPSLFQSPLAPADLAFLKQFEHARTHDLYHDKQFKAVKKTILPKWEFHYGHDMSVTDAMDAALGDSKDPVIIRDGRYVLLSGTSDLFPGLQGRGFFWIDIQEGLALAGFYFHPVNGEPTPTITVFSNQLSVDTLSMSALPPAFFQDFSGWAASERISPVTTRYFIGALNQRVLLAHDEDFCSPLFGRGRDCLQMTADAADADMTTAYYLDQVHYATNATAYMLTSQDQTAFIALRTSRCGGIADPLGCRIRLTREHITRIPHPMGAPHGRRR